MLVIGTNSRCLFYLFGGLMCHRAEYRATYLAGARTSRVNRAKCAQPHSEYAR